MTRVLGLDPGDVRIGVALSDPTGTIASPVGHVDVRNEDVVSRIGEIARDADVELVVIGLPLRLDGSEGPAAERSRRLGARVEAGTELTVAYWDERFTTVTAEQALLEGDVSRARRATARDAIAAAIMLQGFLDRQANARGHRDDPDEE